MSCAPISAAAITAATISARTRMCWRSGRLRSRRRASSWTVRGRERRMTKPILIWGAGAIGGTIGAYLIRPGAPRRFVAVAADHVRAINARPPGVEGPLDTLPLSADAVLARALEG